MQFIDFLILLSITATSGLIAGFLTVKINHFLVILLGKLWGSGYAKKRYVLVGMIVVFCYIVVVLLLNYTTSTDP